MRSGQVMAIAIVAATALFGAGLWYTQTRAYYVEVEAGDPAGEVLVTRHDGTAEPLLVEAFSGIDADTSPIRYRACFTVPMSLAALTETYRAYPEAEPLTAPGWFDCFDADAIGAALDDGSAFAFLGQSNETFGFDRVVVVAQDGRGWSWTQINSCGEAAFEGDPMPLHCPPPPAPERTE
ncbi:histidine kinase [Rhodobacterales bacterium HKCCE2091]|nr:histidine kinase [Rhodobacterales bacterium HKCCE2091]